MRSLIMTRRITSAKLVLLTTLIPTVLSAQASAPALLSQSLAALTGGAAVNDVTLQGTATFAPGPDEQSGPATLEALGHLESLVALSLSGGPQGEVQNGIQAAWSGADGVQHAEALHNSLKPGGVVFARAAHRGADPGPQLLLHLHRRGNPVGRGR